jgi:hypothetical protein
MQRRWAERTAALRIRLLHRMLTPGFARPTDAAKIRGWARVLDWRDAGSRRTQLWLIARALRRPLEAWREAGVQVARFGAEVHAVANVSPRVQRFHVWRLAVFTGLIPKSYADFRLYLPRQRRRAAEYVQEPEHTRVMRWINRQDTGNDSLVLRDKTRFSEWCASHDLPGIPTLLVFDDGEIVAASLGGEPAASLPRRHLFSKPIDATGGHGAERWTYVGENDAGPAWQASDGRIRCASELLAELADTSRSLPLKYERTSRRMLLQPLLTNHADILPLAPRALSTVRLLTIREPGHGPRIVAATFRMGVGDSPADNIQMGGVLAHVDLATGRLGPAFRRSKIVLAPVDRHLETGALISDHQLPYWPATMELAIRALELLRGITLVGWDVAITGDGPVLVEGNAAPGPPLPQMATLMSLTECGYAAVIDERMRAQFGIS